MIIPSAAARSLAADPTALAGPAPQGIALTVPPPVAAAPVVDADGSMLVDLSETSGLRGDPERLELPGLEGLGHDDDLSSALPDSTLGALADDLIEAFEADWESNAEYRDTIIKGLDLLGLKPGERMDMPFKGATGVRDPMLLEAAVRFYANASAELFPAAGPARMQVAGDAAPGVEAVAKRKQDWLNFYLTTKDRGYLPDAKQGLMITGLHGSTFKKVFQDPKRGSPVSRTLTAWDLVVSANTASLYDADRITQIERVTQPEMRRLQIAGYYRDVPLGEPTASDVEDSKPNDRTASPRDDDGRHEVLHQYVLLDIAGLEHVDEAQEYTGLPLPYIVSLDRESRTVLRLVRNYDAHDQLFLPRDGFVHYKYLPGLGFYGWGLIHLVGQSADAATTMLRQAINAFTLATFPGGFKARGLKSEKSNDAIAPCEFVEIDTGGQPIGSVIMPLPYKDVPASFNALREALVTSGQRMGSTADIQVGDGRQDAPVGTTIALIEKATKIESSVVKSLHAAMAEELRMLADLFGRDADEKYPYLVNGQRGTALAADFQTNDDIVPVSDPNAPTQTQRLTLAQGKLQLAKDAGPLMDKHAALEDILRAMGSTDAEMARLMPPQPQAVSADPVTEFQAVMSGKAITPRPDQDHAAHIIVHQSQLAMPGIEKTPPAAALAAHLAEHVGLLYRARIGLAVGQPLPPAGPLPPQIEAQITQAVAQIAGQVAQSMPGAAGPQATKPDIGPIEAQLKQMELQTKQAESDRKALETAKSDQIQIARMNVTTQNEQSQREQKQRDNATAITTALMSYMSQAQKGQTDVVKTTVDGTAQLMAEAQRQSGRADQDRHNAGMELLATLTQLAGHEHEAGLAGDQQAHEATAGAAERTHALTMTAAQMNEAAAQRRHEAAQVARQRPAAR